ncbi:hypothetical protein C656_02635 [Enterococcus hirae 57-03-H11]|nr:hypothetical protein C656_02635 [Enterococcus hirae 57-03-H11]
MESLKKARPHEREQLISSIEEGWEAAKNNLNLLKKDEGIAPDGMTNTAVIESLLFQRKNFFKYISHDTSSKGTTWFKTNSKARFKCWC